MKVKVAQHAGICYGVERALKMALEAAESGKDVRTLGPLIHNPQAVADLREGGVDVAASLEEASSGTLVIRSHGVAPAIIADATAMGLDVVDATCPHVSKAHQAAEELKDGGYAVIIVGEADHPEVEGIMAHAGGSALVVQSAAELPSVLPGKRVGIVVQTTQSASRLCEVVDAVLPHVRELRVFNTICSATALRQRAAEELARQVDVVVVVGGHNSGNTTRLYEICSNVNPRTHHVETADELDAAWFKGAQSVGVTAGASTPGKQMRNVIEAIEALG
ncbi:MAG: 4-hydroxy-3-methylbut-2-enyl diphosphate reductase [Actinobacteria bacterium HGW-Actinobacteria-9]|nr:MAG: 4-hydroxy-3-methylbut-2-enyl diphosphate reductase [Actinobacteria bacterium HGW-Actinobacteria-9]